MNDEHEPQPEIRPNTLAVADHRWKNRAEISERQRLAEYAKSDEAKLDRHWQRNRHKLSAEELARHQQEHDAANTWRFYMDDTIRGIYEGLTAGVNLLWPDWLLVELTNYLREFPAVDGIVPASVAASLEPADFDELHPNLRDYGYQCRIPTHEVHHFRYCVWLWASSHKEDCDADVFADLSAEFEKPAPVAATPAGVRQSSRAEELSMQAHARNVAVQRRIMAGRRLSDA